MILVVLKYFVPKGYRGITIFPFVLLKAEEDRYNLVLINHEKIHIRQQFELLILPFFIWYGVEFLIRYVQYKNWKLAYRNISFEREAYANEKNADYLKHRSLWNFLKFMTKKGY